MKPKLLAISFAVLFVVILAACAGPQGEPGPADHRPSWPGWFGC
jgi:hypothetical protein